jgi:hypothetical protein
LLGHFLDTFGIPEAVLTVSKHTSCEANSSGDLSRADNESTEVGGDNRRLTETAYLQQLKLTHRARARAAMHWRPRFLKALTMSCSFTEALRAAHVSYNTVKLHERNDPQFAAEVRDAEDEGTQLLHDACFKAALEGEVEPVYWQGQIVGQIRKYDNRLRVEMLRAHMPNVFKTPGSKIAINSGNVTNKTLVVGPEERAELIAMRQRSLRRIAESKGLPVPAGIAGG